MNIPKNPFVRLVLAIYVVAWVVVDLVVPSVKNWGIGFQFLSVFGVLLVMQIADLELELRTKGGVDLGKANFTTTLGKPLVAVFATFMYGVPMAVAIANIREGNVDGGIAIIAILHYFVFYFAWVAIRSR